MRSKQYKKLVYAGFLAWFILMGTTLLPALANSNDVLAEFDGGVITEQELVAHIDLKKMITAVGEVLKREEILKDPEKKKATVKLLAGDKILARLGRKYNIDRSQEYNLRLETRVNEALADDYTEKFILPPVIQAKKEREAKVYQYVRDKYMDKYLTTDTVRLRHIFFNTVDMTEKEKKKKRQLAEKLLKKVQQGEDFIKLAKKYSDSHPERRGELCGPYALWKLNRAIARALDKLQPGQVSYIVETDKGFEILKLENREPPRPLPDTIKEEIARKFPKVFLQPKIDKLLNRLWKEAGVVLYEDRVTSAPDKADMVVASTKYFTLRNKDMQLFWIRYQKLKLRDDIDEKAPEYGPRDALKNMVRLKLMVREARARGIDQEQRFLTKKSVLENYWLAYMTLKAVQRGEILEIKARTRPQIFAEVLKKYHYKYVGE